MKSLAALGGGVLLLLLASCGTEAAPDRSQAASPSAATTTSPSAPPSTTSPTAHPVGALARDGIAEVVTDDLVVRSLPEISSASIIDPIALSQGQLLFVLGGPVVANGYEWYHVAPFNQFLSDVMSSVPRLGWVAAGRNGEAWIEPWVGECPEPSLEVIRFRSPFLDLACFGDDEFALEGILGDCGDVVPGILEPRWLANHYCWLLSFDVAAGPFGGLVVRQDGEMLDRLAKGVTIRVVGHFDDIAAQTCVEHTLQGEEPTPPELVVLDCRSQFVAYDVDQIAAP